MKKEKPASSGENGLLSVKVLSATQTIYDGAAWSVASGNKLGPFSIVPGHAGFIALIDENVEIRKKENDKNKINIPIKRAVLHCQNNSVRILVGSSV